MCDDMGNSCPSFIIDACGQCDPCGTGTDNCDEWEHSNENGCGGGAPTCLQDCPNIGNLDPDDSGDDPVLFCTTVNDLQGHACLDDCSSEILAGFSDIVNNCNACDNYFFDACMICDPCGDGTDGCDAWINDCSFTPTDCTTTDCTGMPCPMEGDPPPCYSCYDGVMECSCEVVDGVCGGGQSGGPPECIQDCSFFTMSEADQMALINSSCPISDSSCPSCVMVESVLADGSGDEACYNDCSETVYEELLRWSSECQSCPSYVIDYCDSCDPCGDGTANCDEWAGHDDSCGGGGEGGYNFCDGTQDGDDEDDEDWVCCDCNCLDPSNMECYYYDLNNYNQTYSQYLQNLIM
jgi:hypothetical protein